MRNRCEKLLFNPLEKKVKIMTKKILLLGSNVVCSLGICLVALTLISITVDNVYANTEASTCSDYLCVKGGGLCASTSCDSNACQCPDAPNSQNKCPCGAK
jgi:hypothetical protein